MDTIEILKHFCALADQEIGEGAEVRFARTDAGSHLEIGGERPDKEEEELETDDGEEPGSKTNVSEDSGLAEEDTEEFITEPGQPKEGRGEENKQETDSEEETDGEEETESEAVGRKVIEPETIRAEESEG